MEAPGQVAFLLARLRADLPACHARLITPLPIGEAREVWRDRTGTLLGGPIGFLGGYDSFRIPGWLAGRPDIGAVRAWLYARGVPFRRPVYLRYAEGVVFRVPWRLVVRYWAVFARSGIETTVDALDDTRQWRMQFDHEGFVRFDRFPVRVDAVAENDAEPGTAADDGA